MRKHLIILSLTILFFACEDNQIKVSNKEELNNSIQKAQPGDEIILANGVWKDLRIHFSGRGTKNKPITLRAETLGQVTIEGQSYIKVGGEYLIIDGLYFKNGYTPSKSIISFKIDDDNIANHCKVINCVFEEFSQLNRNTTDHWIEFWGRYNQLDHCYLAGKFNQGPTIRVYLNGNENIRNYHQITNNHHDGNKIIGPGVFRIDPYLKQKLVY